MIVENPYVGWQIHGAYTGTIDDLIEKLENTTGLSFMARKKGDELHGFVTMIGNDVVVSLYGVAKEPDDEAPYTYSPVKKTTHLTKKIESVIK